MVEKRLKLAYVNPNPESITKGKGTIKPQLIYKKTTSDIEKVVRPVQLDFLDLLHYKFIVFAVGSANGYQFSRVFTRCDPLLVVEVRKYPGKYGNLNGYLRAKQYFFEMDINFCHLPLDISDVNNGDNSSLNLFVKKIKNFSQFETNFQNPIIVLTESIFHSEQIMEKICDKKNVYLPNAVFKKLVFK